jgi:hypothetical protein
MPLVAAFSWIGILDSDTIVSLDDATPSHDYYNLHVVHAKPLFHRSLPPSTPPPIFDFPDHPDCATVTLAVALSRAIP